jgi:RHS repeat-associated protein
LSQPTSYLPYGVEQTSTLNGQVKFGTYLRDGNSSTLGLDYADQRYYNPWYGRFNTPDPGGVKTANAADPGSWNRYAYTRGDPINNFDPTGTDPCSADGFLDAGCYDPCANDFDPSVDPYNSQCGGGSGPGYWSQAAIGAAIAAVAAQAAAEQQSAQQMTCSVSLWERPVSAAPGFDHTYLDVIDASGNFTVEGGPTGPGIFGYLVGTVAEVGIGQPLGNTNPGGPGNTEIGPAYTGPNACLDAQSIVADAENYNASGNWVKYNPVAGVGIGPIGIVLLGTLGYNSNSFASTLVNQVGLTNYFGFSGNISTPGWGLTVPGL